MTLALAYDIDAIRGERQPDRRRTGRRACRNNSTPYTSTIVFLVRKGNPKQIKDWNDLVRPGVAVITPNPKTSGGARWNYLAAWGYALRTGERRRGEGRDFVTKLYERPGARFRRARLDDDVRAARHRRRADRLGERGAARGARSSGRASSRSSCPRSASWPSRRWPWSTRSADRRGTREVAKAYLEYLYTPEGQEIAAKNYYRPRSRPSRAKYAAQFPSWRCSRSTRCSAAGQGAEDALRRRRRVRPDLPARAT